MGMTGPRPHAAERSNVDDAPASEAEMRQCFAGKQEWTARIGFENRVPLRKGLLI